MATHPPQGESTAPPSIVYTITAMGLKARGDEPMPRDVAVSIGDTSILAPENRPNDELKFPAKLHTVTLARFLSEAMILGQVDATTGRRAEINLGAKFGVVKPRLGNIDQDMIAKLGLASRLETQQSIGVISARVNQPQGRAKKRGQFVDTTAIAESIVAKNPVVNT